MLRNKFNFLKYFIIYLIYKEYSILSSSSFSCKGNVRYFYLACILEKNTRILFEKLDKFDIIRIFVDLA